MPCSLPLYPPFFPPDQESPAGLPGPKSFTHHEEKCMSPTLLLVAVPSSPPSLQLFRLLCSASRCQVVIVFFSPTNNAQSSRALRGRSRAFLPVFCFTASVGVMRRPPGLVIFLRIAILLLRSFSVVRHRPRPLLPLVSMF